MMGRYLLRIEGVNLGNFVYDTQKLPVIRGGSAILREAPKLAQEWVRNNQGLDMEEISTGASSGLFAFEAATGDEEEIRRAVEEFLRRGVYRHGTFVVDIVPRTNDFGLDNELALAKNRWRQMQSLSVAIPDPGSDESVSCQWDGVRPAAVPIEDLKKRELISHAANARRDRGKSNARREFYQDITGIEASHLPEFPSDFEHLAGGDPPESAPKNLAGKMAVIYLDGNKFGERGQKAIEDHGQDGLEQWDRFIQGKRKALLKKLIEEISSATAATNRKEWWNDKEETPGALRFETLLWGGDEILFVVPAWRGWWLLGKFFELTNGWTDDFAGATPSSGEARQFRSLTHSAGLVFCHYKAPIHRVKKLAEELCGVAKGVGNPYDRQKGDLFAYQVLESFDHVGRELGGFLEGRRPHGEQVSAQVLFGSAMLNVPEYRAALEKAEMPRRKLHQLAPLLLRRGRAAGSENIEDAIEKAKINIVEDPKCKEAVENLGGCFGSGDTRYLHLLELWDYLR